MDRYYEQIEFDLLSRGIDPRVLFQERDWRRLLSLILLLPGTSLTKEAIAQDDELVDRLAEVRAGAQAERRRPTPRLSEWSPEAEGLAVIADRLADVVAVTTRAAGGKPRRTPPVARPRTAMDRRAARQHHRQHLSLVSRLLPRDPPPELPAGPGDAA